MPGRPLRRCVKHTADGGAQTVCPTSSTTPRMSVSLPAPMVRSGQRSSSARRKKAPVAFDEEPDDGFPAAPGVAHGDQAAVCRGLVGRPRRSRPYARVGLVQWGLGWPPPFGFGATGASGRSARCRVRTRPGASARPGIHLGTGPGTRADWRSRTPRRIEIDLEPRIAPPGSAASGCAGRTQCPIAGTRRSACR